MYMYFENVNIVFLYIMQHSDNSGTLNIKLLHIHVKYLNMHTWGVPAPVAQSVECLLRET